MSVGRKNRQMYADYMQFAGHASGANLDDMFPKVRTGTVYTVPTPRQSGDSTGHDYRDRIHGWKGTKLA